MKNITIIVILYAFTAFAQMTVENSGGTVLMKILENGNVGIGTQTNPTEKLEVAGKTKTDQLQIGTSATNGHVLRTDASGNGSWGQVGTAGIADQAVNSAKISNNTIVNADVSTTAAIAGTKINPNFGSQSVTTTGKTTTGTFQMTGGSPGTGKILTSDASGNASWQTAAPIVEQDGVVGNEITNAGNNSLTRTGSGTAASPFQIQINQTTTDGWYVNEGQPNSITTGMITDLTIVNGDVNASAAIAGTKISPNFGSQNVTTTGKTTTGTFQMTGGSPAAGRILRSDASGNASWSTLADVGGITGVTAGQGLTGGGTSGTVTVDVGAGTGISVAANTVSALTNNPIWNANNIQSEYVTDETPEDGQILKYDYTQAMWVLENNNNRKILTNELLDQNILPPSIPVNVNSSTTFTVTYSGLSTKALFATVSWTCQMNTGTGISKIWVLRKNVDGSNDTLRRQNLIGQCTAQSGAQAGEIQLAKVPLHGTGTSKSIYFYAQLCSGCTAYMWPYIVAVESEL
ncbi:hypothetical protein JW935_26525 [candidate division KSB1 bacterium]|nr:hypothetical protein [candidate division KSB1 bacterium]